MSYQFELNQSNRSLRFPVILMAGIVSTVIAAYAFAACGDRNPDQARASEPVGSTTSSTIPVSTGSTEKPAPSGTFKVRTVQLDPTYHYDPKFAFKGVKAKKKFTIKPGPNNPVGSVWIDLTAPSYGIHGTPNPDKVSKTESHGCVRLTNWDVRALAGMVRKGTVVAFLD